MSINNFLNTFVQKNSAGELHETEDLNSMFNVYLTEKAAGLLIEDHEKTMTAGAMAAHIKKLFKMCDDEKTEKKFLKRLGKVADMDNCEEKDIKTCANKICDMDEDGCDDLLHELEGMVDYKHEPKKKTDDDESDDDKKVNEGVRTGSIIKTANGKNMVVLGTLGGGDVAAARLHHGKPMYRTQINLRSDEYIPTGEEIQVKSKKDLEKEQREIMKSRDGEEGAFGF